MSKFLELFAPVTVGTAAVLTFAANFSDRFVTPLPPAPEPTAMLAPVTETAGIVAAAVASDAEADGKLGLGREATVEEVAAWDIDVRPDGLGLPAGSGDVMTGEEVFIEQCAVCHGDFGEGVGRWPVLTGGFDSLTKERPIKTTGSYWPYLSTVYDYIHRAMPFGNAQSLEPDQVYAITAYLLYMNDLVDDDFVLSNENFAETRLPNEENFYMDDRPETELAKFTGDVCMSDCKETVEITARAAVLDVTPEETAAREAEKAAAAAAAAPAAEEAEAVETADAGAAAEAPAAEAAAAAPAAGGVDMELAAAGEKVFKKCQACHQVGGDAKNKTGPILNGIVGAPAGAVDGFRYSKALEAAAGEGLVWTDEELAAFLAKPRDYMKGTKMSFNGLRKEDDIAAVIEYLKTH